MKKAALHWSGGKDATWALYKLQQEKDIRIECLITTFTIPYKRVSMHGIHEELIDKQAKSIGIPLVKVWLSESTSMESYETELIKVLTELKQRDIDYSVFGDIFLEDLKNYREKLLKKIGVKCLFPLWNAPTNKLANDFIQIGFKAKVVALNASKLDQNFAGNDFDFQFLDKIPDDVDPCGENGEFHTFVFDGPIFNQSINFNLGEVHLKDYAKGKEGSPDSKFWFIDLIL